MARPRTVSNAVARALLGAADELSVSQDAFLRLAGLTRADVDTPGGRISGAKHLVLMRLAAHIPFDTRLFSGGLEFLFTDFQNLAAVCANAPTLRHAIDVFLRYRGLVGELDTLVCREHDGLMRFDYHADDPAAAGSRSALANFAMLVKMVRHYDDSGATRFACALQDTAMRQGADAEDFLQGPIDWGQAGNALQFRSDLLDVPFAGHNPLLHQVFAEKLDAEYEAVCRPDSFAQQVERLVRDALTSAPAEGHDSLLAHVCESLHMTRWTLRRRLQGHGCSCSEIIVRVKAEEARRLLREGALPVAEISDRLGFASASSFTRFFREQVGESPAAYRAQRALGDPLVTEAANADLPGARVARSCGGRRSQASAACFTVMSKRT